MTQDEKLRLVSQLGLIEGIKAGAFDLDASDVPTKAQVTALTPVAVADATDLPTAIALANANKAKINQIITALKA